MLKPLARAQSNKGTHSSLPRTLHTLAQRRPVLLPASRTLSRRLRSTCCRQSCHPNTRPSLFRATSPACWVMMRVRTTGERMNNYMSLSALLPHLIDTGEQGGTRAGDTTGRLTDWCKSMAAYRTVWHGRRHKTVLALLGRRCCLFCITRGEADHHPGGGRILCRQN